MKIQKFSEISLEEVDQILVDYLTKKRNTYSLVYPDFPEPVKTIQELLYNYYFAKNMANIL